MSIKYVLRESSLKTAPDTCRAAVQPIGTAEMEDVIARMELHGSTVVKADILSVLEDYYSAIESLVLEGMNVNTPSANYRTSIRGAFDGLAGGFDPSQHRLVPCVSPGKRLRKVLRAGARPQKMEAVKRLPSPLEYTDRNSDARNSTLTPGGIGRLVGTRLKFDGADPRQGVFFLADDGTEVRAEVVGKNMPRELIFLVPALAVGAYTLEVRATFNGTAALRTGALEAKLAVVAQQQV